MAREAGASAIAHVVVDLVDASGVVLARSARTVVNIDLTIVTGEAVLAQALVILNLKNVLALKINVMVPLCHFFWLKMLRHI